MYTHHLAGPPADRPHPGTSAARGTRHRRRRRRAPLVAVGLVAPLLAGCVAATEPTTESSAAAASAFGHIHGLGINAASGKGLVATHSGVYELPGLRDDAVAAADLEGPIADQTQDTMGFTAVTDRIFASGHPDPAVDPDLTPPNLGLITSADGAESWQTMSRRGETDFHDLTATTQPDGQYRVYGLDSATGEVSVSKDGGSTWTAGATLAARDLQVDPALPDTVYATTAEGLVASTNGGTAFTPVEDAPALYLLADLGDASGGLVGVDVEGVIWSKSGGDIWREGGKTTGEVAALSYSATPEEILLVADDRGVVASDDFGVTWRMLVTQ